MVTNNCKERLAQISLFFSLVMIQIATTFLLLVKCILAQKMEIIKSCILDVCMRENNTVKNESKSFVFVTLNFDDFLNNFNVVNNKK